MTSRTEIAGLRLINTSIPSDTRYSISAYNSKTTLTINALAASLIVGMTLSLGYPLYQGDFNAAAVHFGYDFDFVPVVIASHIVTTSAIIGITRFCFPFKIPPKMETKTISPARTIELSELDGSNSITREELTSLLTAAAEKWDPTLLDMYTRNRLEKVSSISPGMSLYNSAELLGEDFKIRTKEFLLAHLSLLDRFYKGHPLDAKIHFPANLKSLATYKELAE